MIYKTDKLILTPLHKGLLSTDEYNQWMNDPEVCKYNSHGNFPISGAEKEEFFQSIESGEILVWSIGCFLTITKPPAKYIGNISLQSINWIYRSAELAIMIGEKNYWGKGLGAEACRLVLLHGFERLNLHRIWLGTACTNYAMIKTAQNLDMELEGTLKESLYLDGCYVNEVRFGILKEKWMVKKNAI